MKQKQKNAVIGMILGDAYLQKTGAHNARLRLEHSLKQKTYLEEKVAMLKDYFPGKIQALERFHQKWGKSYQYVRIQSHSSPEFGKIYRLFYKNSQKGIPNTITKLLHEPITLAIWFMDDGYYYPRDKMSYIYIPKYDDDSIRNLLFALKENFDLSPIIKSKKHGQVLVFSVSETAKLMRIINKHIIPSMRYKTPLDPVSTDRNLKKIVRK